MRVSLIAAMAKNRVIGSKNQLPWHLPEDLKRFKALTLGHPILMGRKTFESIGKPLPGRENVVLSRQKDLQIEGVLVLGSLPQALDYFRKENRKEIFIIGGAEIYRQALPLADRIYLTEIDQSFEGDAFFPDFSQQTFHEIESESRREPIPFAFRTFEKVNAL